VGHQKIRVDFNNVNQCFGSADTQIIVVTLVVSFCRLYGNDIRSAYGGQIKTAEDSAKAQKKRIFASYTGDENQVQSLKRERSITQAVNSVLNVWFFCHREKATFFMITGTY
jgi:predicted metalloprotease